jgi:hypothetical protein
MVLGEMVGFLPARRCRFGPILTKPGALEQVEGDFMASRVGNMQVARYTPDDLIGMTEFHIEKYSISFKYFFFSIFQFYR